MKSRFFLKLVSVVLLAVAPLALAAFDPVNDDTDIFLANPNITAERPNVLIILDNTANWNVPFTNEKNALVQVVDGLSDQYNVGLMMFPETGGGNDSVDGGYVRYHVRQMTSINKTALSLMVNNLDKLGDKGNNATTGLAMYEAYLYYAGKASLASFGKVKTDFTGNTANNPLAAPLTGHALPANPTAASLYTSPVVDGCQRNFIIYISNGPANENATARSKLQDLLAALVGKNPPDTIAITPSGQQGVWADETAKFMANADVTTSLDGVQNVFTYVVEVDANTTGLGPDMTALLKSMASNGKGKYFGVSSSASGSAIVDALNAIFTEVQAVNSVFASATLPVSVNVRGTNLNQVYMGVFRPDANNAPRWFGNLKLYNLALNSTTSQVFLADAINGPPPAVGNPVENTVTGFVTGSAVSFWTTSSNFWAFRDPSQNGVGGSSDAADGDLVEKGGAAQQLRIAYAAAENSSPKRNLHTCTTGGFAQCLAGSALSDTPFNTANSDIDAVSLQLGGSDRTDLINWVRGEDNFQDENSNLSLTDVRASVHGDVLHSRPAVVNYNRFGSDNDVYVFYGANDGIIHAIKGGYATDGADPAALAPGREAWGFIPKEFFGSFTRMRNNSPTISSSFKKPYFADGPIGIYTRDANGNGKLGDTGDVVNLYIAMRRGGRFIYALDVNNPNNPRFLWKIDNTTTGFSELGQTWSDPTAITSVNGYSNPVLIFGAGYDPAVEDIEPSAITSASATSVTTAAGTVSRTMGRGIYVVDAITGALVWSAGRAGSGFTLSVPGMDFAIPSNISVIENASGGPVTHAYVGDTGGQVWRIDFAGTNLANSTVTKLAAVGDLTTAAGRRKFMFPPDVVGQVGFDAVLVGSGDREHPFDTTVVNRMYMFKDKGTDAGPVTGTTVTDPTIVDSALFDATTDCIQDPAGCSAGQTQTSSLTALNSANGWFITLGSGEKVVGNAVSIASTTFFNTNQPSSTAGGGMCGSNLGIARQYEVNTADATATNTLNTTGGLLTAASRSTIHAGGGYLPSPVHVVVILGGKPVEVVISGTEVSTPAGPPLSARLRKYWYKEIE